MLVYMFVFDQFKIMKINDLSETIVANQAISMAVGPTLDAFLMEQFANIEKNDRFYYENSPSIASYAFTIDQLVQIRNVTLAGLTCNNYDFFTIQKTCLFIRHYIFYVTKVIVFSLRTNPTINCKSFLGQLNLSKWLNMNTAWF